MKFFRFPFASCSLLSLCNYNAQSPRATLAAASICSTDKPLRSPSFGDARHIFSSSGRIDEFEFDERDLEPDESLLNLYQSWMIHFDVSRDLTEQQARFKTFKKNASFGGFIKRGGFTKGDELDHRFDYNSSLWELYQRWRVIDFNVSGDLSEQQARFETFKENAIAAYNLWEMYGFIKLAEFDTYEQIDALRNHMKIIADHRAKFDAMIRECYERGLGLCDRRRRRHRRK